MRTHKDLNVWNLSVEFVVDVYQVTKSFPSDEKFGLVSQLRRAAVSIPSNIAEGAGRDSSKEYIRFLSISMGSLSEVETQILIAYRLSFLSQSEYNGMMKTLNEIRRMILGLKRYVIQNV